MYTDSTHRHNKLARFVNETAIPSQTTPVASTSTSSTISIPFSNDASLASTPISRISTSGDGQQDPAQKPKNAAQQSAGGIAIDPMQSSAPKAVPSTPISNLGNPSYTSQSQQSETVLLRPGVSNTISLSSETAPTNAFSGGNDKAQQFSKGQDATAPGQSAFGQSSTQSSITQSATLQSFETPSTISTPRLPAAFADVRLSSKEASAVKTAAGNPSPIDQVTYQVSDSQATTSQSVLASPTSIYTASDQSKNAHFTAASQPALSNTTPSQGIDQPSSVQITPASSVAGASASSSQTTTRQSIVQSPQPALGSSISSSIIQVPSALLRDATIPTASSTLTSAGPPSKSSVPQYPYPNANSGNVAMATGFNAIFQTLTPESRCDPSNADQASACVDGQPARCEVDGRYSLISCDQGKSCFAMPLSNGQSGLRVECQEPSVYQKAVAVGDTTASNPSSVQTAQNGAPSSVVLQTQQGKDGPIASSIDSNQPMSSLAPTSIVTEAQANTIPSSADAANGNIGPTFRGFFQSVSTVQEIQQTSAPLPSPSPSPTNRNKSGVVLNFPAANGLNDASPKGQQAQPSSSVAAVQDTPPVTQKEKVPFNPSSPPQASTGLLNRPLQAAAGIDGGPSSTHSLAASSPTVTSIPGVTIAPMVDGSNTNGPVTVTVTYTTTVHDR